MEYIPVDFIKAHVKGLNLFEIEKRFECELKTYSTNGEIHNQVFKSENLTLNIYPSGLITLSGSLHKFFNNGVHNYNQFNQSNFNQAIKKLEKKFGIKPENLFIKQLEYGVNITPPKKTEKILNGLILHKKIEFKKGDFGINSNYLQSKHNKYIIKVYDKGKQNNLKEPILRFEKKVTNWSEYRQKGITTLKDFIEADKTLFLKDLVNEWEEVLFADLNLLKTNWNKYTNKNYWLNLSKNKSNTTFKKHKDRLKELNAKQKIDIQKTISETIYSTISNLQGFTNSKRKNKVCQITGIDISAQREDSKLLSHKGLRELFKENPHSFFRIRKVFLSNQWENQNFDIQIREIAHNIRAKSNYYEKRFKNQYSLFQG